MNDSFIQHQRAWLCPQATGEWDSGPRRHAEQEHPYRTCFQRDRDRVIHCSAFRRLDYKTQVFVPHEQDHFRTRLTHTLEVAQVARTLARALRANEDLAEAVALAHDLGHPPFGHAGESVLAELMAAHGHFEHNRQSLRIVDYLEHPYPAFRGLNLTAAVRECLARHSTRYDTPVCEDFAPGLYAPLEGQIVDAADEIAYTSADVDDALAVGWISLEDLSHLALWQLAWGQVVAHHAAAREIHKQIRATKALVSVLADDVIQQTAASLASPTLGTRDAVQRASAKCVHFSPAVAAALEELGSFLLARVYQHPASKPKVDQARRCIGDLFARFIAEPSALPARYLRRVESDGLHRVVCDYIAGMTDRFCLAEHEKLCGQSPSKT